MPKNYIFEKVYVETPVDSDLDGKYDLVKVFIKRPITEEKLPVLYVANPYLVTCNEDWYDLHDVNLPVEVYSEQNITKEDISYDFSKELKYNITEERVTNGFSKAEEITEEVEFDAISGLYDYFLDKGYASVFCGGLGTLDSEGITKTGSQEEILAFKAVIDWLNGRARAFTDKVNNIEVKADWTTGKVAMTGKSYLGTLTIGLATTGVEGLETIIPEAAISNWYEYYRYNGLNLPALGWQGDDVDLLSKYCFSRAKNHDDYLSIVDKFEESQAKLLEASDRLSGNYNKFWDERNYLNNVGNIKASVLIIHGFNDWNVKTSHCYNLYKALEEHNIPRRMYLHQGEHIYIYKMKNLGLLDILEEWFAYYLKGEKNGLDLEPGIYIQSNLDQSKWVKDEKLPELNTKLMLKEVGVATFVDDLNSTVYDKKEDNQEAWLDELVLEENSHSLKYYFDINELGEEDIRLSSFMKVSFQAAIDKPTAILSAMLVDISEDRRITAEEVADENGYFILGREEIASKYKVITRGWLNAQNRVSNYSKVEIEPGKFYEYEIDLIPTDYTLREGSKLVLIIYGIDAQATQRPDTITTIQVKQDTIKLECSLSEVE